MAESSNLTLEELLKTFPQIVELKNEGNINYSKGDYGLAIDIYTKAKEIVKSLEEKINKDFGEDDTNTINDGVKTLKDSLKKENVSIHSNLALCYFRKKNYQASIDHDLKVS